jgi:beta-lactamase class A
MSKKGGISQTSRNKRKRKRRIILKRIRFLFIVLCTALTIWYFLGDNSDYIKNLFSGDTGETKTDTLQKVHNSFTPENKKGNTEPLKDWLENYIKGFEGKYGIYYYNLIDNEEFGINDEDEFTAASTIKIPLNLYLYEKIKSGNVNPDGILSYQKQDYETGTGIIQSQSFGKKYTVRELSKLSIEISDNVAANMLFRFLGAYNVKEYMRQKGAKVVYDEKNISSPRDMGLYMKLVYEFYKENSTIGDELMSFFLNTKFNDRLPALLPETVKVAHKIGTQVKVFNDVGIVFAQKPYIVSVMTDNINEAEAANVIANISKKIFDYVNNDGNIVLDAQ